MHLPTAIFIFCFLFQSIAYLYIQMKIQLEQLYFKVKTFCFTLLPVISSILLQQLPRVLEECTQSLKLCTDRTKKCVLVLRDGSEKCINPHFFFHEVSDNYVDCAHHLHTAKLCLRSYRLQEPASKPAFCCSCMCRHLAVKQIFLYIQSSFHPKPTCAPVAGEPMFSCSHVLLLPHVPRTSSAREAFCATPAVMMGN